MATLVKADPWAASRRLDFLFAQWLPLAPGRRLIFRESSEDRY
jgi:hypothetical protein